MHDTEKTSRRQQCIFDAVNAALAEMDYRQLTIEEIASRAGVGKSTIYRWWKDKSALIFDCFRAHTESIFALDFDQSLRSNLNLQLLKLSLALTHPLGRAVLVVMAEDRETAAAFFKQYLLPRREQMRKLLMVAIERGEIEANYPFEMMLDTLYGAIHYQIIFFNHTPDQHYIQHLVDMVLAPVMQE